MNVRFMIYLLLIFVYKLCFSSHVSYDHKSDKKGEIKKKKDWKLAYFEYKHNLAHFQDEIYYVTFRNALTKRLICHMMVSR